jgi:enoyl-CoA hydratase
VAHHRLVARQRHVVNEPATRFNARPFDAETHPVNAELGHEVEHLFVVAPELIGVAGSSVAAQSDGWRVAGGRTTGLIESALDRVTLNRDEKSRSRTHPFSFARARRTASTSVCIVARRRRVRRSAMADEILRERRGHVELLTINRPEARNAINRATAVALSDALDKCELDDDVWVVVLTGAGDKAFSAGMDLKAFATGEFPITDKGFGGLTTRDFPKPLIAAANGSALAGGFEMMISCDMVVAASHAKFGIPEASRGLVAGAGGLLRLPRRVPLAVAYEMALTADPIDATRAYELGLVNRVVPGEQVLDAAIALAERIAKNAPLAVRTSKDIMHRSLEMSEREAWVINDEAFAMIGRSADAMEGAIAFAEKREPQWRGA